MALKTTKPERLDTPEEIAHYLDAIIEGGDLSLFVAALGDVARGIGMNHIANKSGIDRRAVTAR